MRKKIRMLTMALITIVDVLLIITPGFAVNKITLNELYRNPEKYYGKELIIWGTVGDIFGNGFILRNDIGWEIEILTEKLPERRQQLEFRVRVERSKNNSILILRKVEQKDINKGHYWLYFIGAMALVMILKVLPR